MSDDNKIIHPVIMWRRAIRDDRLLTAPAKALLYSLAEHMNADGSSCFPSVPRLSAEAGLSERSARKHLKALERMGWLSRKRSSHYAPYTYTPQIPMPPQGGERGAGVNEVQVGDERVAGGGVNELQDPPARDAGLGSPVGSPVEGAHTHASARAGARWCEYGPFVALVGEEFDPMEIDIAGRADALGVSYEALGDAIGANLVRRGKHRRVISIEPPCPQVEILALYFHELPELPRHDNWHGSRKSKLRSRWQEDAKRQDVEWWRAFFRRIHVACPFLLGDNPRGWKADLDWITGQVNLTKILEERYTDNPVTNGDP